MKRIPFIVIRGAGLTWVAITFIDICEEQHYLVHAWQHNA